MDTNKKQAFYFGQIWIALATLAYLAGHEIPFQYLVVVAGFIGAYGGGDMVYDFINAIKGNITLADSPSVPIGIGLPPEADTGDPAPIVPDVFPHETNEKKVG
jgi:hypothetical protein